MKTVIIANKERELNRALKGLSEFKSQIVPYSEGVLKVVQETRPDVVVLSLFLPGEVEPSQNLHELTTLDEVPQIILLAGNLERKDPLINEAISYGIYDIIFTPSGPKDQNLVDYMVGAILDRINCPRNRKMILEELGISSRKAVPVVSLETIERRESNTFIGRQESVVIVEESNPFDPENSFPILQTILHQKPYLVGVISPASAGATFFAQNLAAALAMDEYKTALVDFDGKRDLHYWFGRDERNRSFTDLFEKQEITDAETSIPNLDAFTSFHDEDKRIYGELGWFDDIENLPYETVVLDFSSGQIWRKDLLIKSLEKCDEVLIVGDMDYVSALQSRPLWEALANSSTQLRFVLNKWSEEHLACEERDLAPLPASYYIPYIPDVYRSIVYTKPLVSIYPKFKDLFMLNGLLKKVLV